MPRIWRKERRSKCADFGLVKYNFVFFISFLFSSARQFQQHLGRPPPAKRRKLVQSSSFSSRTLSLCVFLVPAPHYSPRSSRQTHSDSVLPLSGALVLYSITTKSSSILSSALLFVAVICLLSMVFSFAIFIRAFMWVRRVWLNRVRSNEPNLYMWKMHFRCTNTSHLNAEPFYFSIFIFIFCSCCCVRSQSRTRTTCVPAIVNSNYALVRLFAQLAGSCCGEYGIHFGWAAMGSYAQWLLLNNTHEKNENIKPSTESNTVPIPTLNRFSPMKNIPWIVNEKSEHIIEMGERDARARARQRENQ